MTTSVDAIYEEGSFRPLQPMALTLAEHARVRLMIETVSNDPERAAWLAQSKRCLREVWDNDADEVFNELLAR